ncbi:unnamed protein product [Rotaria sp. Silwood2]|nr:unnamed protein product [Rotaria sp. Silwood2]CAF4291242.1 unnamed protein product [Rotaria sp. Silwood2]
MNNSTLNQYQQFLLRNLTLFLTAKYSTTSKKPIQYKSYSLALKLLTIFAVVFIFIMILIRLCYKFLKRSRSSNNLSSNHRMPIIRPEVSTIELPHYKPDLPPAYPEAIANIDNDDNKLPSYDDLKNEQTVHSAVPSQT